MSRRGTVRATGPSLSFNAASLACDPAGSTDGLAYERAALAAGYSRLAGVDEAGRGAWAGPVVAAAVILAERSDQPPTPLLAARDSKALTAAERDRLFDVIHQAALAVGVGVVEASGIDAVGVGRANRQAMRQAIAALAPRPAALLIDFERLDDVDLPIAAIVDGDALSLSIGAASIIAKVTRDRRLVELDAVYPGYGFAQHKGYGTPQHRAALARFGPCPIHRRSYAPIAQLRLPFDEP